MTQRNDKNKKSIVKKISSKKSEKSISMNSRARVPRSTKNVLPRNNTGVHPVKSRARVPRPTKNVSPRNNTGVHPVKSRARVPRPTINVSPRNNTGVHPVKSRARVPRSTKNAPSRTVPKITNTKLKKKYHKQVLRQPPKASHVMNNVSSPTNNAMIVPLETSSIKESADFFNVELSDEERTLYNRQFRLEGWSQSIVKNSRVLIVGVGGLGCEIAKNLAMLGVGHLDLIDLDIIEHSNLNRQILFTDGEIGQPKALAAAEKLKEINPNITIKGYFSSLEQLDPSIYEAADVIIGGLDSMNARLNLNTQAIRFKKPLIDGGVAGYHGHVYTIFPYENACFECNPLPPVEDDEMAACTVVGIPRKRNHCIAKGKMAYQEKFEKDPDPSNIKDIEFIQNIANELSEKHNFPPLFTKADIVKVIDQHEPGIITINAVISALQSHETIKILHYLKGNNSLGEPVKTYTIFNGMRMQFYSIKQKRRPDCSQCGDHVNRVEVEMDNNELCQVIIDRLEKKGFKIDEDMLPTLTVMDFNDVKEINVDLSAKDNDLRNLELISIAGFQEGDILLTLKLKYSYQK